MFDIESIIKKYTGEDGSIPADAVAKLAQAVNSSVGREFVEKSRYSEKLEEIETLKTEKQTAEDSATTAAKWETKYKALKDDFENFKADAAKKESRTAKENAYRALLKAAGISEKRIDSVLRVSDVDGVELDDKGKIKGSEALTKAIQEDWADFIVTTETKGADTAYPPANNSGSAITKADIFKTDDKGRFVMDTEARQKAIAENIELFRKG